MAQPLNQRPKEMKARMQREVMGIEPGWFTANEAAAFLNTSRRTFDRWAKHIPAYAPGRRRYMCYLIEVGRTTGAG